MLIEKIIFNLLAVVLFIIIFFKIISKNDTGYVYFLILQFIGIAIGFFEIVLSKTFSIYIKTIAYFLSIIIPILIIILEKNNINFLEYIYVWLAKILKHANKSKAKKILINLVTKYPNSYLGHKMLAGIYVKEGGRRKAIDEYVKVIDINKKDFDSYYEIASLLNELDKKQESIQMLTTLVNKKPDYYKASILLGGLLCEKEKFKDALNIYQNALKYDPTNYEIYYNMGIAYTRLNDFKNAKECYNMAAEINCEAYSAYYNLGIICLMFGDINDAKEYFYKCTQGEAVEARGYYNLARISIINGEKENAINYLNQAIELNAKLSYKALEDNLFIPIKKYIHIPHNIENIEEKTNKQKLTPKELKAQEHLEKTYEIVGTLSKNEIKKMNSFKENRIDFKDRNLERE